ncbi:MAG TPA: hypothetical protein VNV66_14230 [Pilimelia sp.]|nr:hypothetical protein [Pilimelia sp.]
MRVEIFRALRARPHPFNPPLAWPTLPLPNVRPYRPLMPPGQEGRTRGVRRQSILTDGCSGEWA